MKTGWWIVIGIIVLAIISFFVLKNKQNKVTTDVGGVIIKKPCSNLQLTRPPDGKVWCCVNGDWIIVDAGSCS